MPVPRGTEHDGKVLEYCYHEAHKASEIAAHLGIRDSSYLRQRVLKNLLQERYLLASKQARAQYYRTNPEAVRPD